MLKTIALPNIFVIETETFIQDRIKSSNNSIHLKEKVEYIYIYIYIYISMCVYIKNNILVRLLL